MRAKYLDAEEEGELQVNLRQLFRSVPVPGHSNVKYSIEVESVNCYAET